MLQSAQYAPETEAALGLAALMLAVSPAKGDEDVVMHVNQVAYDLAAPKFAILETSRRWPEPSRFRVQNTLTLGTVFEGTLAGDQECAEWFPGKFFYRADFSALQV